VFFFQAEDGIRDFHVTGVQTCALPISSIHKNKDRNGMPLEQAHSLSEQIAKHISEQIIRGELVEGERIQELRIASELDVSRGSVREALLLLERTQLIEIYPRRGAIVSEMSALQVRALFDITSLLLGQMVHRMAETWRSHEAERIQLLLEQLEAETRQGHTE